MKWKTRRSSQLEKVEKGLDRRDQVRPSTSLLFHVLVTPPRTIISPPSHPELIVKEMPMFAAILAKLLIFNNLYRTRLPCSTFA